MKLLRLYLRRSRGAMTLAVAAGVVSGGATAWLLALVNTVLTGGPWTAGLLTAFIGLCLLRLVGGVVSHVLLIRLSQRAILDLRMDLCEHILRAPLRFTETLGPHRLTACFTDDIVNVSNIVVNIPYFLVNIVVLAGCLAYLGWLSAAALLGVSACLIIGVATYLGPVVWATRHLRLARERQDELFGHFRSVSEGTKELKLHAPRRRALLTGLLRGAAERLHRHNVAGITIYAAAANWNRLLFFVYVGLMLFALPAVADVPRPALTAYILVILYMMAPLEAILNTLPHLARADVSLAKIESLGRSLEHAAEEPAVHAAPPPAGWRDITLRGVVHRYHDPQARHEQDGFTLGPIDLRFEPGEVVYLVGGNGSGKTTFVKVLTGLYTPDAGEILVDAAPIDAAGREAYRQMFAAVFSDFHLFDRLLGIDGDGADARAAELLDLLRLDRKLFIEGGRFSTTALSQGQRKRLALLTALMEDRPFYVFDEPAADQDPAFKQTFYQRIVPALRDRGKAVLVVTHDDRYHHLADRVLKLEAGRMTAASRPVSPLPSTT